MNRAARKKNIRQALARLAAQERRFLRADFLAPVVRGAGVRVRIAGVVCRMIIDPSDFEGWGVFVPISHTEAMLDREATMGERRRYLDLLPRVRLVVCRREGGQTLAGLENRSDSRLHVDGLVELRLAGEGEADLFDTVVARFDGAQFWFDEADAAADPGAAAYLRRCLVERVQPDRLERPGLSGGQREAYRAAYDHRAQVERRLRERLRQERETRDDQRMRRALWHAGAVLRDFAETSGQSYRVTYDVDGERHTSLVRRGDLTVLSAGICLSGQDTNFDLGSLVGVLREASGEGRRPWRR